MHSSPLSSTLGLEPGCGPAERSPPMLGLIGFVGAERDDAARLGHAEHVVPQLGIGGPRIGGHDRIQIAAAHGRQIASCEGCGLGRGARCPRRNRLSWSAARPPADRASDPRRRRWSTPAWRRRPGWRAGRTRIPPIQKNGELQNSWSSAVRPRNVVENLLVFEQRRVRVHNPLGAPVEPDVYTMASGVGWVDVVLHRLEQPVVGHVEPFGVDEDMAQQRDCRSGRRPPASRR